MDKISYKPIGIIHSPFKEPKGVLTVPCPFCSTELKIEFEDNSEKDIYRSMKVKL